MHAIIETKNQLERLQEYCEDSCFVQIISNNDNFHPKFTNVVAVYYHCLNSKGHIFPINYIWYHLWDYYCLCAAGKRESSWLCSP